MGLWKYHRYDFVTVSGSSGNAGSLYNGIKSTGRYGMSPYVEFEWDDVNVSWVRQSPEDRPINLTDAESPIFIQYDTATTFLGGNETANQSLNIASAPVGNPTTAGFQSATLGFSGSSSGNYYHSETGIPDGRIGSFALTNAPPSIKLRVDNVTGSSSGYLTAFVSFKTKQT